jgi:hypothetical protein
MTTLTVNSRSALARNFITFAQTLPFVNIENNEECPICKKADYRLRPDVEDAINSSPLSKSYNSAEKLFEALGI